MNEDEIAAEIRRLQKDIDGLRLKLKEQKETLYHHWQHALFIGRDRDGGVSFVRLIQIGGNENDKYILMQCDKDGKNIGINRWSDRRFSTKHTITDVLNELAGGGVIWNEIHV